MIAPDDLEVGQWVLINSFKPPEIPIGMVGAYQPQRPNGCPLEIVSINLPFVMAWTGGDMVNLDIRILSLQRVTADYVEQFFKMLKLSGQIQSIQGDPAPLKDIQERYSAPSKPGNFAANPFAANSLINQIFGPNLAKPFPKNLCPHCGFKLQPNSTGQSACSNPKCGSHPANIS